MILDVYESYKQKCLELGLKPTPQKKIFAEDIIKEKNEQHVDITELSQARKTTVAPVLSEIAKKALVISKVKAKKIAAGNPKTEKPVKTPKNLTDEEKNPQQLSNDIDVIPKIKVEKITTSKPKKILSEDEKERAKKRSRLFYLQNKDSQNEKSKEWMRNNKDKVAVYNKNQRDKLKTEEQLEERRKKAREYYAKNIEKLREKDRARNDQRKQYLKDNPDVLERIRARERERYERNMNSLEQRNKLREKWRKDGKRKRQKELALNE